MYIEPCAVILSFYHLIALGLNIKRNSLESKIGPTEQTSSHKTWLQLQLWTFRIDSNLLID